VTEWTPRPVKSAPRPVPARFWGILVSGRSGRNGAEASAIPSACPELARSMEPPLRRKEGHSQALQRNGEDPVILEDIPLFGSFTLSATMPNS